MISQLGGYGLVTVSACKGSEWKMRRTSLLQKFVVRSVSALRLVSLAARTQQQHGPNFWEKSISLRVRVVTDA